jgi:hypothetical protein
MTDKGSYAQRNAHSNPMVLGALVVTLAGFAAGWLALPKELLVSDPWMYSRAANNIAKHWDFGLPSNPLHLRIGVVWPVAVFYKIFGVNIVTTNLWPLLAALLLIVVVWCALPDLKSKVIGLGLCLLSAPLWDSTMRLNGDIIATAFMAASVLLLTRRDRAERPSQLTPIAVGGVAAIFVAFLAKETAYWAAPLWLFALFEDRKSRLRLRRFWVPAVVTGLLLGLGYLLLCHLIWGDALVRLRAVDDFTHQHLWARDRMSSVELLKRLSVGPLQFFAGYYGALFFFGIVGILVCPKQNRYWVYYLGLCIGLYWFGSASLISYQPLPLVPRLSFPTLPAFLILAAHLTARLEIRDPGPYRVPRWAPIVLIAVMMFFSLAPFAKVQVSNPLQETQAMAMLKNELIKNPASGHLLITSDKRSPDSLEFFFGYQYPSNLRAVSAEDGAKRIRSGEHVYVYIHKDRSEFLKSAYGDKAFPNWDEGIESLGLHKLFESPPVTLFEVSGSPELERLKDTLERAAPGT